MPHLLKRSVAVVLLVVALSAQGQSKPETYASKVERWKISALAGDPDSAYAVSTYYLETTKPYSAETAFWLPIAAENGHVIAMGTLAAYYKSRGGALNCTRAAFWIRKAQASPDLARYVADRARYLRDMSSFESSMRDCAASSTRNVHPGIP